MRLSWIYVFILVTLASCEPQPEADPPEQLSDDPANSTDTEEPELKLDNLSGPLFLVEFVNENSTDEKSKRTIDNNLGYGYLKNNLFSGKYNYYFPNGKTGTTVTIEESLTPFEPKTIIETEKPPTKLEGDWTASFPPNQQVFGQRTKLRKYNPSDYTHQNQYSTTAKPSIAYTTIRPEYNQNAYTTAKTIYQNSFSAYSSTPSPNYNSEYVAGLHPPGALEATTLMPPLSDDPAQFNIPRFTVENGIRYENKIVWKYPDGRIAEPPSSFINHYSEYSEPQRTKINHQNAFRETTGFRNPNGHQPSHVYKNNNLNNNNNNNNIYSQRPATFPNDQESFSQRPGGTSQSQAFNLSYQNNYGYRRGNNNNNNNNNNNKDRFEQRPYSKYAVDSSNPEYTPAPNSLPRTTESPQILTQGGQLSPQLLNKYKPQVQQYLSKLFTSSKESNKPYDSNSFIENNYEQLLNYNPSISQYVKDPSSILQAYPTFIQSGKSLVPVIILRVDGVRPVEQQTPNINLKSLLQQYLSQYASEGRNPGNHKSNQEFRPSPVDDLTYLTEALKRFSPNSQEPTRLANHPLEYESTRYTHESSYDTINSEVKPADSQRYNKFTKKNGQKVKSVQIIDGPHYTN